MGANGERNRRRHGMRHLPQFYQLVLRNTRMQTTRYTSLPTEQRQRCEVWTRVMGYHRPVSQFNIGKRAEHRERRHFIEGAAAR